MEGATQQRRLRNEVEQSRQLPEYHRSCRFDAFLYVFNTYDCGPETCTEIILMESWMSLYRA